jgi:kumamolisin
MPETHAVLAGSRRFNRSGTEILGRADANEWVEVTIKVRRKAPLPEPVAGGTAMTREELGATHGAADGDLDKVQEVLGRFGLTLISRDAGTRVVKMAGTVEDLEQAFNLHLFRGRHEGHLFRSRQGDIYLPKELDGIVTAVFGLDSRRMVRRRKAIRVVADHALKPPNARPWFLPQELAAAYNFTDNTASGQCIGILEFGGKIIQSDLQAFAKVANLKKVASVEQVDVDTLSPTDANDADAIGEVMLDVEVVAAICPDAKVVGYFSNFTEQGWVNNLDAAIHDTVRKPGVLSISWGLAEGEEIWTGQAMQTVNEAMQEAAILGIPVCLASGDDGSDDQAQDGKAHVDFPSSSPFVLCVGGTMLSKKNGSEIVWKEGDGLRKDGAGGGGVSGVFPRPSWQKSITISSVNPGAIQGRVVPDVAANAAGSTGYLTVANGSAGVVGGTSAAAPLWAALIARLNTARKKSVGFLTPLLYQPNPKTAGLPLGQAALKDITKGNNKTAPAGGYSAAPGYDAASGWGSPDGVKLQQLLP